MARETLSSTIQPEELGKQEQEARASLWTKAQALMGRELGCVIPQVKNIIDQWPTLNQLKLESTELVPFAPLKVSVYVSPEKREVRGWLRKKSVVKYPASLSISLSLPIEPPSGRIDIKSLSCICALNLFVVNNHVFDRLTIERDLRSFAEEEEYDPWEGKEKPGRTQLLSNKPTLPDLQFFNQLLDLISPKT